MKQFDGDSERLTLSEEQLDRIAQDPFALAPLESMDADKPNIVEAGSEDGHQTDRERSAG